MMTDVNFLYYVDWESLKIIEERAQSHAENSKPSDSAYDMNQEIENSTKVSIL